jgi:hypothetical protein
MSNTGFFVRNHKIESMVDFFKNCCFDDNSTENDASNRIWHGLQFIRHLPNTYDSVASQVIALHGYDFLSPPSKKIHHILSNVVVFLVDEIIAFVCTNFPNILVQVNDQ